MFLPQMAPMWWMTLMMMFLLSMMICMQMLYFNFNKFFKTQSTKKKKNMNWSW